MGLKMRELPADARPYEKSKVLGLNALDDAELLAMILRTGTREENSVELSRRVIASAGGSLAGLLYCSTSELEKIPGIGRVKALQIKAVGALAMRLEKSGRTALADYSAPEKVAMHYLEEMRQQSSEVMKALFLNTKCRLIRESVISKGSVNRSLVPVREIFVEALEAGAVYLILMHNHPSGDPTPSEEDVSVTKRIQRAGEIVGVELLDHLVYGDRCFVSMREKGWMS